MAGSGFKKFTFGIFLFFSTAVVEEELSEFYRSSVRPSLLNFYSQMMQKSKKEILFEYRNMILYNEFDVMIVVRLRTKNYKEFEEKINMMTEIHSRALIWLRKNGKQGPIHEYLIEDDKVNILPNIFQNLKEIDSHDLKNDLKLIKKTRIIPASQSLKV